MNEKSQEIEKLKLELLQKDKFYLDKLSQLEKLKTTKAFPKNTISYGISSNNHAAQNSIVTQTSSNYPTNSVGINGR